MFCASFQVYSVIVNYLHCPSLVHIRKRWKFSKFFSLSPFFILEHTVVILHIGFVCIVIKNCYTTSYKDPSVADLFSILILQACG